MEVTIPTSWEDVTVEMYIKLRPVLQAKQEPIERVINLLCVLTDKKRNVIRDLQLTDYQKIVKKMKFLETELPNKLKSKYFKIGGDWYTFKFDARQLSFGEYISTMELLQDASKNEEIIHQNLHRILTAICRPVKRRWFRWKEIKLDGELLRKTTENIYKNMPITIAYPIGVFFYHHLQTSTQDTRISLIQKATEKMKEAKREMALLSTGDGGH